jgi:energy-converting hydrogenase Eha subunit C
VGWGHTTKASRPSAIGFDQANVVVVIDAPVGKLPMFHLFATGVVLAVSATSGTAAAGRMQPSGVVAIGGEGYGV